MLLLMFGWLIIPCLILGIILSAISSGKRGVASCLLSLIGLFAVLVGAFGFLAWMTDDNVYRNIHDFEIEGKWRLTSRSLSYLASDGYKNNGRKCTIVLRDDRTAIFSSVNDAMHPPQYETKTGFWRVERNGQFGTSRLFISEHENKSGFISFGFLKHDGEIRLSNFYGDPDMWEFIEYRKVKIEPP